MHLKSVRIKANAHGGVYAILESLAALRSADRSAIYNRLFPLHRKLHLCILIAPKEKLEGMRNFVSILLLSGDHKQVVEDLRAAMPYAIQVAPVIPMSGTLSKDSTDW